MPSPRDAARALGPALVLLAVTFVPCPGLAQQSIFNAPATTGTRPYTVFFQEQLNLGERGESNLTVDYGLPEGFEVGLNVFGVGLYDVRREVEQRPMFMLNAVWTSEPAEWLRVQVGVQGGTRAPLPEGADGAFFGWASMRLRAREYGSYVIGVYAATSDHVGVGTPIGLLAGIELPIVPGALRFAADVLWGTTDASVAVAGLVILLPDGWQLSFGAQLPVPQSENHFGAVFELTRVPP